MSEDPYDDPEIREWAQRVLETLVPMIQDSAVAISLVPSGITDVKFAVELGVSIMLNKPLIVVVTPGARVPPKLIVIADEIIEGTPGERGFHDRLNAAVGRQIKRIEG